MNPTSTPSFPIGGDLLLLTAPCLSICMWVVARLGASVERLRKERIRKANSVERRGYGGGVL